MKVTCFTSFDKVSEPLYRELEDVLTAIRTGAVKALVEKIRVERSEKEQRRLKNTLPCVLFSGVFTERKDAAITEHSGLCILDFDKIGDVFDKKEELKQYPFIYAIFVSPRGNGLKALVKIPPDAKKHRGYYKGLMKMFPEIDSTSQNESRICFMCYDPDIHINENAIEFDDWIGEDVKKEKVAVKMQNFSGNSNYHIIARAASMVQKSVDGDKHRTLLKAAKLLGGYIASGQVQELDATHMLESEISKRDIDDIKGAKKAISDGIEYGKRFPLEQIEREIEIESKSEGIIEVDEVWEKMKYTFINGKKRGTTTYFEDFDKNFTWKKGELTLVIGQPNSGKSEWFYQLMLLKSVFENYKWGIFSPENFPVDEFYDTLIHACIGKSVDPYYKENQMTMAEYETGYEFVKKHFFYIYPDGEHTIEEIESRFLYLIENKGIDGVFIDPFNQLSLDMTSRDDKFLSTFLSGRKRFSVAHNLCYLISAHPKSMARNKEGKYDVPDIYDINNGAMWGNKMDNIMAIYRPNYHKDPSDTLVEVHVKKIKKQKLVGIPGMCEFTFSRRTNRYYCNGKSPLDHHTPDNEEIPPF